MGPLTPGLFEGIDAVVNRAGPFAGTAEIAGPVAACLAAVTHHLDVTGELAVFEDMFGQDGPPAPPA
ncbi:hypothetical protein [Dactylosporangium sp. NPDC051484]|uniref:hypothetical protein n=1 Tax=Dactylosporangium sp. NPDC051484 TaxID=3154942 RepID=UPI00344D49C6